MTNNDAQTDAANNADTDGEADNGGASNANPTDAVESAPESQPDGNNDESTNDTFPRSYVEDLRKESAGYRDRAKTAEDRADVLAKRLHRELVTATARLENPDDLPFDAGHLDDENKLSTALDALLSDRPYMAKRVVKGDAGQGPRGGAETGVSLLGLLKGAR